MNKFIKYTLILSLILSTGSMVSAEKEFGLETMFHDQEVEYVSVAMLNDTHVVVAYQDRVNMYGYVKIGVLEYNKVVWGDAHVFNMDDTYFISLAVLDETHFVIAYSDNASLMYGTSVVGIIGSGITFGTPNVYESAVCYYNAIDSFSDNRFAIVYREGSQGRTIIGSVSGSTIVYGARQTFNPANIYYPSIAVIDDARYLIGYRDGGNANYGTCRIAECAGTTINLFGSEVVFESSISNYISVDILDDTKFVVAYYDGDAAGHGTAIIGDYFGTIITGYGTPNIFNADVVYLTSVARLSDTSFVVNYRDGGHFYYGMTIVGGVTGDSITSWSEERVYNQGSTYSIDTAAVAISEDDYIVVYKDLGGTRFGYSRVWGNNPPSATFAGTITVLDNVISTMETLKDDVFKVIPLIVAILVIVFGIGLLTMVFAPLKRW